MYLSVEMIVALTVCLWQLKNLFSGHGRKQIRILLIVAGCATVFAGLACLIYLQYGKRYGLYPERAVIFAVLVLVPPCIVGLQWGIQRLVRYIREKKNKL